MTYDWTKYESLPGWHSLIKPLIEECKAKGVQITQIKEKFGGLRFYVGHADDELHDKIVAAERKSHTMCEVCGDPAETKSIHGWLSTLCGKHRAERS